MLLVVSTAGAQSLEFDRTVHDFGQIESGEEHATTFRFINTSGSPVTIEEVFASCGCTAPYYTDRAVQPGASGEVHVVFDATGRRGPFHQGVRVAVQAEGEAETYNLVVRGRVVPRSFEGGVVQGGVRFDAEEVDAGVVPAGEAVTHVYTFRRTGVRPLVIHRAHSFPEGAQIRFPQRPVFRDDVAQVEVVLPVNMIDGPFDVVIALETDDADEAIKVLRLIGEVE